MSNFIFMRILFCLWTVIVIVVSVIPYSHVSIPVLGAIDPSARILHFSIYFIMVLLLYYSFERGAFKQVLKYGCFVFIFSLILELIQLFIPYRGFSFLDIAANAAGIACFICVRTLLW
jgi:VanZ family protein